LEIAILITITKLQDLITFLLRKCRFCTPFVVSDTDKKKSGKDISVTTHGDMRMYESNRRGRQYRYDKLPSWEESLLDRQKVWRDLNLCKDSERTEEEHLRDPRST